jgi:hypothetical protein
MFDLTNLLNRAPEMFEGSDFQDVFGGELAERLSELSADSGTTGGARLNNIQDCLSEADPSSVSETQLSEVLATVTDKDAGLEMASLLDRLSN